MPRKVTPSQFRREVQRLQQKQRQAVNDYNRAVKKVNDHNKKVIDDFNRGVRAHNTQVRRNRQRLMSEINRLNSQRTVTTVRYVTYQTSVEALHKSFVRVEASADRGTWAAGDELFELAEGETANSFAVLNALEDETEATDADDVSLRQTLITNELSDIDADLDSRWRGALFALSPLNPDAARHFCTSVREIFIKILDMKAPDDAVMAAMPNLERNQQGQVPRRAKIGFILGLYGRQDADLVDFVDRDIDNIMELFSAFNPATHGAAGRYNLTQLVAMKVRVEGAIQFLYQSFSV